MSQSPEFRCSVSGNCPFPSDNRPCEPTSDQWKQWRQTPQGLQTASYVGECMQERKNHDPRTGFDTFEHLRSKLISRFSHPARQSETIGEGEFKRSPVLLGWVDGDDFSRFNDIDHDAGDLAITAMASTLADATRETDMLARRGGDEFVFAMFAIEKVAALKKMTDIRTRLAKGGEVALGPEITMPWRASIVGVYMENPCSVEEVLEGLRFGDQHLATWKRGDRTELPPLMLDFPVSDQLLLPLSGGGKISSELL